MSSIIFTIPAMHLPMDAACSLSLAFSLAPSLKSLSPRAWDACANPDAGKAPDPACPMPGAHALERDNPFLSYGFLRALEESQCVGDASGWVPFYGLVHDGAGALVGAAPAYLKAHSMGEYVFDHAWARAYEQAGGHYYPKLQLAVPFTPVTGRRLLAANVPHAEAVKTALLRGFENAMHELKLSSIHITFPDAQDAAFLERHNYLARIGEQFHFRNRNFRDFADFLDSLASRKRKAIKRERKIAVQAGLSIEPLTGSDLTEAHFDAFFEFYMDTGARKWGHPYLNRAFFSLLRETMADKILLVLAKRAGRYIAGALNLMGQDALYGRYWGAVEHHDCLHFELCYYQAIDHALAHGFSRVEAGAQGEHKLARGYEAVKTHSAHSFSSPALRRAVKTFLADERRFVEDALELYAAHAPFKQQVP